MLELLIEAIKARNVEQVEELLNEVDDINYLYHGWALLHYAVDNDKVEVAGILLKKGANINLETEGGTTPLYMAVLNKQKDMTLLLLVKGADVSKKNKHHKKTPLEIAYTWGDQEVIKALLERASVNKKTKPLVMAIKLILALSITAIGTVGITNPRNFMGNNNSKLRLGLSATTVILGLFVFGLVSYLDCRSLKNERPEKIGEDSLVDTNLSNNNIVNAKHQNNSII